MLIVIAFLFLMTLIVLANSTTLYWVKQEILRVEQRQQPPGALGAQGPTNVVPPGRAMHLPRSQGR